MNSDRVFLYDTTLRDGAQTMGVDFTVNDKIAIAKELDRLKIDYIEGGWPGANPVDTEFFANLPTLNHAKFTAFGMTRRANTAIEDDRAFMEWMQAPVDVMTIFGKTWDFQAEVALGISLEENLNMIRDSVRYIADRKKEMIFDAEHFFDGYRENPDYAIQCIKTALDAGADWVILCDTNGGMLPDWIGSIVKEVCKEMPGHQLGIHCHNDTENGVANSLAGVTSGVRHVQGTINGLGERCGNGNLISIIPNLMLKMGFETALTDKDLAHLTCVSRMLDDRLNRQYNRHAPFVGESAFAHKGGVHASAIEKDAKSYEHISPEMVGNRRHILVSNQAGKSNVINRLRGIGLEVASDSPDLGKLVDVVKDREFEGYSYDLANASFELLARKVLGTVPTYYSLINFRVIGDQDANRGGSRESLSEAIVKLEMPDGSYSMTVAEGNGPVDALDAAMRKALLPVYPSLETLSLLDYKVRILESKEGTASVTRVLIESGDREHPNWVTVGVSASIIEASYQALSDAIQYKLMVDQIDPACCGLGRPCPI